MKAVVSSMLSDLLQGESLFPDEWFALKKFLGMKILILKGVNSNAASLDVGVGIVDQRSNILRECALVHQWIGSVFEVMERQDLNSATFYISSGGEIVKSVTCHFEYLNGVADDNDSFDVTKMIQSFIQLLGDLVSYMRQFPTVTNHCSFGMKIDHGSNGSGNLYNLAHFQPSSEDEVALKPSKEFGQVITPHVKMTLTSTITDKILPGSCSSSAMMLGGQRAGSSLSSFDQNKPQGLKRKNSNFDDNFENLSSYSIVANPIQRPAQEKV